MQIGIRLLAGFGTDELVGDALVERGQAGRPAADLGRIEVRDNRVLSSILWEHSGYSTKCGCSTNSKRKAANMGSEVFLEWPTVISRATGTVLELDRSRRTVMIETRNGVTIEQSLNVIGDRPLFSYVRPGDSVTAYTSLLAGVVRSLKQQALMCPGAALDNNRSPHNS